MRTRHIRSCWGSIFAVALSCGFTAVAHSQPPPPQQTLECAKKNLPPRFSANQIRLTAHDRTDQTTHYLIQVFAQRDADFANLNIRVQSPPDLLGGAYLVHSAKHEREIYVYVPVLNKSRRIHEDGNGTAPLLGTDLSVSDLVLMGEAFRYGSLNAVGQGSYQGRSTQDLVLLPSPSRPIGYDRLNVQIDQQTCVPLHVELFKSGKPYKEYLADSGQLTQVTGGYWYVSTAEMRNVRDGTRTTIHIDRVDTDKLPQGIFDTDLFYRP